MAHRELSAFTVPPKQALGPCVEGAWDTEKRRVTPCSQADTAASPSVPVAAAQQGCSCVHPGQVRVPGSWLTVTRGKLTRTQRMPISL